MQAVGRTALRLPSQDRAERRDGDLDLIRRYYLKNGYADFRVASADARFDDAAGGWIITITVEEGQQYRVGAVSVDSRIPGVDGTVLRDELRTGVGDVYNAEDVEKTLTGVTTSVARSGYPFAQVRPTGERDRATGTVALGYIVEDGPKVYIERINVRGNTRTRDYVVRRELDLTEGDAYNRVLVDRAERRLNGLGFFKKVRFSNEPGSAPDRVIVNIDVEDQPTGSFSVAGGYSTADGIIGEVSVSESNFLGRGQYVRIAGTAGQYTRGVDFSFTEPYFLGYRLAAGFDVFNKYSDQTRYSRYVTDVVGGQLRLGLPITEEFGVTLRYSIYNTDLKIPNTLKRPYNDCSFPLAGYTATNAAGQAIYPNCAYDGEASIALKEAVGSTLTSLAGVTLAYSTLDNLQLPRNGFYGELKPEFAGLGGDSKFFRVTGEARLAQTPHPEALGSALTNDQITTDYSESLLEFITPALPDPSDDCDLCEAARITPWFHEDDICWIAECEQCCVPMAVWKRHDPDPSEEVRVVLKALLGTVVAIHYGFECWFDEQMRTIPSHYHVHARPVGGFMGHGLRRG